MLHRSQSRLFRFTRTPTVPSSCTTPHSHPRHRHSIRSSSTRTVATPLATASTSTATSTSPANESCPPCSYPCPVCICDNPPKQPPTNDEYLRMILTAKVYDVAIESPLQLARTLSRRSHHRIYLKREDLQTVFSFKLRGAYNKMASLTEGQKKKGVLTCSAGNHAQGVALASHRMGVAASIVMPVFTPAIKVNAVRNLGADVILHGNDFDQAQRECIRLSRADGRLIIHPYDDPFVIAGQGTIGLEILRQYHPIQNNHKPIHTIFIPVGGGGIIAGVALYVKQLHPSVLVIGVETDDADSMAQSLEKGERTELKEVGLFADGAAVRLVGKETFRICKSLVDGVVRVNNDELCAAIKDTFEDTRSILEPAGALSVAGCKKWIAQHTELKDESFVCITSGANMNFNRLRFVAERAELGEKKEALLSVTIPETPGSFMRLYSTIFPRSVTEFSYRYNDPDKALIYIAFEVKDRSEVPHVMEQLQSHGMQPLDISDNEMAKNHTRYLAGGRSLRVRHERVYRFEFPERPGALMRFLQCLNNKGDTTNNTTSGTTPPWNVTLFHYRNYGSDFGKVLCGIEVPPHQQSQFDEFLATLGYPFHDETDNPVYKQFLL